MFYKAKKVKGNKYFNDWDVSSVTNMSGMFADANAFNQPLNNWDVSSVTDMDYMFKYAKGFKNQDLSSWNVNNVASDKHDSFVINTGGVNTEPIWNK
jgi:surface protein